MSTESLVRNGDPGPYTFVIRSTDTDCNDHLHLFALFSFMQEAAYYGAEYGGLGTSTLDSRGLCWMLVRISIRLDHLPSWGDKVTVKTWNRGSRRLTWLRDYEFFDQHGVQFGAASSEWLIADARDHRPQKPDLLPIEAQKPVFAKAALTDEIRRPGRLDVDLSVKPDLVQYADFSDIDRNRHVNNTRYAAWCMNAVHAVGGEQVDDRQVRELDIQFISELKPGDKIHCYCSFFADECPDGEYRVEARRADDASVVVFRASVRMA